MVLSIAEVTTLQGINNFSVSKAIVLLPEIALSERISHHTFAQHWEKPSIGKSLLSNDEINNLGRKQEME